MSVTFSRHQWRCIEDFVYLEVYASNTKNENTGKKNVSQFFLREGDNVITLNLLIHDIAVKLYK